MNAWIESNTMNIEDVKRKCAAMLAKAASTDNIQEAEAFLAKAHEMMEKYQLELYELQTDDPMGSDARRCAGTDAWIYRVLAASAKYWGAKVMWEKHTNITWGPVNQRIGYRIFGPESARTLHAVMIDYLNAQVRYQGRLYARDHGCSVSIGTRNVGIAFAARLNDLAAANKVHRDGLAAKALVPVDTNQQLVESYYKKIGVSPNMRSGYTASAIDYAGKISLAKHVPGAGGRKMIR